MQITYGKKIEIHFNYNKRLVSEVKAMDGARYHPDGKYWTVNNSARNIFQLQFLEGKNPYARFDTDLLEINPSRSCLMSQQVLQFRHIVTRRQALIAAEMGTGKTLATIEAMEFFRKEGYVNWWWVSNRAPLAAAQLEFKKWGCKILPRWMTYAALRNRQSVIPDGMIFDECASLKNPTSQQSMAALDITNKMRAENDNAVVVGLTGTPAPKEPTDWWHICEVICPGFLKEGNIHKFKKRLAIIEQKEGLAGNIYPSLVTWRDNPEKCDVCGQFKDEIIHTNNRSTGYHIFKPSVNEIEYLGQRLEGLTIVQFKKDCMDLPEKRYEIIQCPVAPATARVAKMITETAPTGAKALLMLRALSDGFRYFERETDVEIKCPVCNGKGEVNGYVAPLQDEEFTGQEGQLLDEMQPCYRCLGTGKVLKVIRDYEYVGSPKEDALRDLLGQHEEVKRLVVYAGFHASIDICHDLCIKEGWHVLQMDGRGIKGGDSFLQMLERFQSDTQDRLVMLLNPGSGSEGITLHKSPSICYYSNTFNGKDRMQSEDRIHRPGMDVNRGATIYDLVHLKTDELILNNLRTKKELQTITLEELQQCMLT